MSEVQTPAAGGSGRWISYHLFLPDHLDSFLADCLPAWVRCELRMGHIKRFFFIRYSEGGPHLRLRVVGGSPTAIQTSLEACVRAYFSAAGAAYVYRLEEHRYHRTELYFGETYASVYAELLNEATSKLALRLLRTPGMEHRVHRWLVAVATFHVLLHRAARDRADLAAVLAESQAFAQRGVRKSGAVATDVRSEVRGAVQAALPQVIHRVAAVLEADPSAARIVQLLRRMRQRTHAEQLAATHGLHLLCNKLGFSFQYEYELFELLGRIPASEPAEIQPLAPWRDHHLIGGADELLA